jgi:hypothetical protein
MSSEKSIPSGMCGLTTLLRPRRENNKPNRKATRPTPPEKKERLELKRNENASEDSKASPMNYIVV